MERRKISALAWAMAIVTVLAGCSQDQQANGGPKGEPNSSPVAMAEQTVSERVNARWQALIEGDFAKAYAFESPGYRSTHTERQYRARFGQQVAWTSAEISDLDLTEKDVAKVRVMVRYKFIGASLKVEENMRPLEEKWVHTDNNWWHILE